MDLDDLKFLQTYFRDEEKRDPTITEVRVVDTYWSDHCRHTTFSTHLDAVDIGAPAVKAAYQRYLDARVGGLWEEKAAKRPQTLMDIATIGTKTLKSGACSPELDESEGDQRLLHQGPRRGGRQGAGLAAHVQERDPQPPPPRSSASAVRPPASAAASGIPSPGVLMSTRPCASPAAATPGTLDQT